MSEFRRKDRRLVADIKHFTKKLSKAELTQIMRDSVNELLQANLPTLFRTNQALLMVVEEEVRKFLNGPEFRQMVYNAFYDDNQKIRKLLEDVGLQAALDKKDRSRRPVGSRPRRIKL